MCPVILIGHPRKKPVRSPKDTFYGTSNEFLSGMPNQNDKGIFFINPTAMVSFLTTSNNYFSLKYQIIVLHKLLKINRITLI